MNWQFLKGKFIVLDGPDGSGKSTQIQLLRATLEEQGVEVVTLRDPGGTKIGEQIRRILLDNDNTEMSVRCEALLYMASRAQLYSQHIKPALEQSKCVLCDRWISSTYAYQVVAGKMDAEDLIKLAQASLERTWPDLSIIVDLASDVGLQRAGQEPDRMEQKSMSFHQQVREAFLELAQSRDDFKVVDGSGTIAMVQEQINEVIKQYVGA